MRLTLVFVLMILPLASLMPTARAGETERIGGPGGDRTVRMECGPNSFITYLAVRAGSIGPYDTNLVRMLRVGCRVFDGSKAPDAAPVYASASVEPRVGLLDPVSKEATCPPGHAMYLITVKSGLYIDRVRDVTCRSGSSVSPTLEIEVGGGGGLANFFSCPRNEALYRIDARAGDAVDSIQGFCRAFPPPSQDTVAMLNAIRSSLAPKPPLSLSVSGSTTQLTFVVPDTALNKQVRFQVTTLPTGGASFPAYRMEFVDPTGSVVQGVNATVTNPVAAVTLNHVGTWKLRLRSLSPGFVVGIQSIGITAD